MQNLDKYTFPTKNGQLLSTEPHPNGNMLRSTAELLILDRERLSQDESVTYLKGIEDCKVTVEVIAGIWHAFFSRYQDAAENTSVDDLLVVGSVSDDLAKTVLGAARSNYGFYSVDGKRTWSQFIFRFQGMWQHLRIVAGESVGIFGSLIWAFSLYLAAKQPITNQDSWCLSHLMVLTYERSGHKSFFCELAIEYWRQMKTRNTSDIMADYTGIPDHPLVEAWKPYK